MTTKIMTIAAACLLSASLCVNAGDLEVDNLTLYGKLEFANQFANEGDGTATGGTITNYTLDGTNYTAHIFTDVGESNFVITGAGALTCSVLVVAGGGGPCLPEYNGGGGGAGGLIYTSVVVNIGTTAVYVGVGGTNSCNGNNSIFGALTAIGGGAGGPVTNGSCAGNNGGSGGGSASDDGEWGQYNGGAGTPGQGCDGGDGDAAGWANAAGGGGAGGPGADAGFGGAGGPGITNNITGTAICYAAGGSGTSAQSGAPNTGNGAGGATYQNPLCAFRSNRPPIPG